MKVINEFVISKYGIRPTLIFTQKKSALSKTYKAMWIYIPILLLILEIQRNVIYQWYIPLSYAFTEKTILESNFYLECFLLLNLY